MVIVFLVKDVQDHVQKKADPDANRIDVMSQENDLVGAEERSIIDENDAQRASAYSHQHKDDDIQSFPVFGLNGTEHAAKDTDHKRDTTEHKIG